MIAKVNLFAAGFAAILISLAASQAQASSIIVNINAADNDYLTNPVDVQLGPGTYTLQPIGPSQGGLYTALDFFEADVIDNEWWNGYVVSVSDPPNGPLVLLYVGLSTYYSTPADALAHGITSTITLTSPTTVEFGIGDSYFPDNQGGESLLVSSTPEPSEVSLLGTGLAALGFLLMRRPRLVR